MGRLESDLIFVVDVAYSPEDWEDYEKATKGAKRALARIRKHLDYLEQLLNEPVSDLG